MFSKAFIAGLFGLAAAYTKPVGPEPVGNPIFQPGLNSVVPVGSSFTINWKPTTQGTVTLLLLKGPSENVVYHKTIVEKIPNSGSYVWTPTNDLAPSQDAKGYGIQLIDDATGQYQYSTQFGISNANYKKGDEKTPTPSTPAAEKPKANEIKPASEKPKASEVKLAVDQPKFYEAKPPHYVAQHAHKNNNTAPVYYNKPAPYATGVSSANVPRPTGYWTGSRNTTNAAPTGYKPIPSPTKTASVPNAPVPTFEGPVQQTGAASNVAISFFGLVTAGVVAVLAI